MAKLVHLHAAQEIFPEDERVRMVAKRAVAERGFPFDGLLPAAAMVLAQLELSAGLAQAGAKPRPEK
jgi:antitoxin component of RelBE/YafQ-DinJ toxin-antitoxin module